ncbi:TPA: ATP-binding protein [Streptococcus suis 2651]|uniref:ATP-binding protein n=1 Tax=Streptococcus suis TaxID=1307 RepID=UPI00041816D2|nr:ATP-binding protein [Streptococcus suis]HEL1668982.1 ATP-binding protein [Streptococcus suis]HEL1754246.1 ATP-binding protein [Streptococcus suis]HEM3220539.1 ATP-binding protein [Streptococcus suis 2651]
MQITKGKRARAQRVVIYGPEGIGKSSLAAQFPNPLFIDTEGSTDNMDVARADKPTSWTMLMNHIAFVKANPTICQTLVIDTIDWAEALALQYICAQHNKSGIEDFGWGAGYTYLIEEIGRLLDRLQELVELGINVVLTAHAQVKKFTKPDELGGYDRYELKLSNKKTETNVSAKVKEWADMVLFLNYKTYIITDDKTKKQKAQGGQRVMQTTHSPSWDAKNRHNLPEELPMDFAGIAHIFATQTQAQPTSVQEQPAHEPAHAGQEQVQEVVPIQPTQSAPTSDISPLIPQSLRDLMIGSKVTQDEVLQATYVNGIYPLGTQVEAIDAGYWEYMVTVWDKVLNVINTKVRTNPEMPFTVEGN